MNIICPSCDRLVRIEPYLDGYGQPIPGKNRFSEHAGNKWGRICDHSGDLVKPYEEPPTPETAP